MRQEDTREVTRKPEDHARQQSLKRYETCSPRGVRHHRMSNELVTRGELDAPYTPRRMFVKR